MMVARPHRVGSKTVSCRGGRSFRLHRPGFTLVEMLIAVAISGVLLSISARLLWMGHTAQQAGVDLLGRMELMERTREILARDVGRAEDLTVGDSTLQLQMPDNTSVEYAIIPEGWVRMVRPGAGQDPIVQKLMAADRVALEWSTEELARGRLIHLELTLREASYATNAPYRWSFLMAAQSNQSGDSPGQGAAGDADSIGAEEVQEGAAP